MKEATTGASSKGKAVAKGSDGATDGKKKFEVKKVRQQPWESTWIASLMPGSGTLWLSGPGILSSTTAPSAVTISWISVCLGSSSGRLQAKPRANYLETQVSSVKQTRVHQQPKSVLLHGVSAT